MDDLPQRKPARLSEYDYSQNGAYFVTVCTKGKSHLFGSVVGAAHPGGPHTAMSPFGMIVERHIQMIPKIYQGVFVDAFVVIPNHIHLLIRFDRSNGPAGCPAPTTDLPKVIGALKSLCSRESGCPLWQRGYYEHIIRNEEDYFACWDYIANNPAKWAEIACVKEASS